MSTGLAQAGLSVRSSQDPSRLASPASPSSPTVGGERQEESLYAGHRIVVDPSAARGHL